MRPRARSSPARRRDGPRAAWQDRGAATDRDFARRVRGKGGIPMDEPAATPSSDDALFEQAWSHFKSPPTARLNSLLSVALVVVFVASMLGSLRSLSGVALLVGVLLVHEAGHALGMRAFGFRDVQMFFIPFFGAAVSGRPRGTAAWKDAMVSLLGPLPGLFAGFAVLLWLARQPHPTALPFQAAEVLLFLNAFNLLPVGFLDGGRFFARVLFSRHRLLEIAFFALGNLCIVLIGVLGKMWFLALFAGFALFGLPNRWRVLSEAASLRRQRPALDPDPDRLGEDDGRALFAAARTALREPARDHAGAVAEAMESILAATQRAPGALASVGLLLLYGLGLVVAVVGLFMASAHDGAVEWQRVGGPGWSAEFPRYTFAIAGDDARTHTWRTGVGGVERFTVTVTDSAGGDAWLAAAASRLAAETRTKLAATRTVAIAGRTATEFEFTAPNRVLRARLVATESRRYQVTTSAPKWGQNQRRFLESFTLRDSTAAP